VVDHQREHLRRSVLAARDPVLSQVGQLEAAFDEIVASSALVATDDEHDPEGHTIAFERQQIAALLRDARIRLADLDAALLRIDDGTYGTCRGCDQPIDEQRLRALPGAVHCIHCAEGQR
jgi:DnaK suppressor protein